MTRVRGSINILPFPSRSDIPVTSAGDIKHLAKNVEDTPLEQFNALVRHQRSFLRWIDSRHEALVELKRNAPGPARGPKDAVYRKYRWYAEQLSLLEVINGFEVFYKKSLVNLGIALYRFIPLEKIKGEIEARVLWGAVDAPHPSEMLFEHRLYHDLSKVDEATRMLIGAARYNPNSHNVQMAETVRLLNAIFQIRHTLSHNQGYVTASDCAKFKAVGFTIGSGNVIDPSVEQFGTVVREFLSEECRAFTDWMLGATAKFLQERERDLTVRVREEDRVRIETLLGSHAELHPSHGNPNHARVPSD